LLLLLAVGFVTLQVRSSPRADDSWWVGLLLAAVAIVLIGRLVLAEKIPGDRQFWVTRPYRWRSLLGAKILFMGTFVNLPILLAQFLIVAVNRFPLASALPGLLWSQALLFALVGLPSVALAAISSSLPAFFFLELVLLTGVAGVPGFLMPLDTRLQFDGEG
jgi:hypothetical protein